MEITVETLSAVKKKLNFEVPTERVMTEYDKAFEEIRKKASIKGFRKGKVPRALIEKHYADLLEQDVVKNLINETYFKAIADEKLMPVSYPVIENGELEKGKPFKYSAVVEIFPEVVVKDYDGLEICREKYVPDDKVIDDRLNEMQTSLAQLKPVADGRAAATGDFVIFDFEGFINGEPFENGSGTDYQLELGSGKFIPGFEEQLVGLHAGEEGEIKVTFPQDYGHADFAGKDALFKIRVKEIKSRDLPPIDDEFAGQFGEFKTLQELKEHLKVMHEKQEQERIDGEMRDEVVKALIARNDIQVPDALVDQQTEQMLENAKQRLAYQRLTLEMMGLNEETYRAQFRTVAETQVKGSLLLDALAKQENISAGEGDLDGKFLQMAGDSEQSLEAVRGYYLKNQKAKENLFHQIKEDKAVDLLLSRAKITEKKKKKEKKTDEK